jgi:hypothetical protein
MLLARVDVAGCLAGIFEQVGRRYMARFVSADWLNMSDRKEGEGGVAKGRRENIS